MKKAKTHLDLRDYLKEILEESKAKNPRFSLRSMALKLDLPPSMLSKLIHKKIPLSEAKFSHLVKKLNLSPEKVAYFKVQVKGTKSPKEAVIQAMDQAYLQTLTHWSYTAILESAQLTKVPKVKDLAALLEIDDRVIRKSLKTLAAAKLIQMDVGGESFTLTSGHRSTLQTPKLTRALSKRKISALQKSIKTIRDVDAELRDHTAMTLAIDPALLPVASEKIKAFRRELATFLEEKSPRKTAVYELDIGLFPLSKVETKKS